MKKLLLICLLAMTGSFAFGNGYQVLLQGNKETAMGNAGAGLLPSASALFFNPGALGFLERTEVQLGGNGIFGRTNYVEFGGSQEYTARPTIGTGYLYAVYAKDSASRFRAGVGVFTPFGSLVEYDDPNWPGRYSVRKLRLVSVFVQPTVAYRISKSFSIGLGLDIAFGDVVLQRRQQDPTFGDVGDIELSGKSDPAFGFNAGLYFHPFHDFSMGISYRSKVDAKVSGGDVTFTNLSDAFTGGSFTSSLPSSFDAEIPLPSVFTIGFGAYPTHKLNVAMDLSIVGWSAYEKLQFDFNDGSSSVNYRRYTNSMVLHFGAEYMLTEKLAARAGFYYDDSPVSSGYMTPETPDANARGYTAGLGYEFSDKLSIDLTFLYLDKQERSNTVPDDDFTGGIDGTFKTNVLIPGFGITWRP